MEATQHYAEIYSSHVRLSATSNDAIGGGGEAAIGFAQARILADAGVMTATRVLEIGFGKGRVWGGLSQLFNLESVLFQGVDVVEVLLPLAKVRVMAESLCRLAGRTVIGSQRRGLPEPYAPDGTPFTNHRRLLLTPTHP
jgi:hypothetical protein